MNDFLAGGGIYPDRFPPFRMKKPDPLRNHLFFPYAEYPPQFVSSPKEVPDKHEVRAFNVFKEHRLLKLRLRALQDRH